MLSDGESKITERKEIKMKFQKGYELQRLIAKLRIRGMYSDADKLEKGCCIDYLSNEAAQIIKEEMEGVIRNPK